MKQCSGIEKVFFLEITMLLRLYLVSSATNVVIEKSTSTMQRIENWLGNTITQERLSQAMQAFNTKKA